MISQSKQRLHLALDKDLVRMLEQIKECNGPSYSFTVNRALRYWMEITGEALRFQAGPEVRAKIRVEELPPRKGGT